MSTSREASRALGRPKYPRPRVPRRVAVEITDRNRDVLACLLHHMKQHLSILESTSERHLVVYELVLARAAIAMLDTLLLSNPKEIVVDPKDVVANIVVFTLDSVCANVLETLDHASVCMDCTVAATRNAEHLGTPWPPPPYFDYVSQTWLPYATPPPSMYAPTPGFAAPSPHARAPGAARGYGARYDDGRRTR